MTSEPLTMFDDELRPIMPDPEPHRLARTSDPATSHAGARSVRYRAGSQKARLLVAYAAAQRPLTDSEAAYPGEQAPERQVMLPRAQSLFLHDSTSTHIRLGRQRSTGRDRRTPIGRFASR